MANVPRTRSGRVPAVPRPYVRNPLTNRRVVVNGPTYRRIAAGNYPGLVLTAAGGVAVDISDMDTCTVVAIANPSPPPATQRRNAMQALTPAAAQHAQDVITQGIPLNWDTLTAGFDGWYQMWAVEVEIGPYLFVQNQPVQIPGNAVGDIQLADNRALSLPFTNVDRNAGDNNECVRRFFEGFDVPEWDHREPSVQNILNFAFERGIDLLLYDAWGQEMAGTFPASEDTTNREVLRGIIYRGHIYPVTTNGPPVFVSKPHWRYASDMQMRCLLAEEGRAWYQLGDTYYVGPGEGESELRMPMGVYRPENDQPEIDVWQPWMQKWFAGFQSYPWASKTVQQIKHGLMPLYFDGLPNIVNVCDLISIDVTRCYWTVLCQLLTNHDFGVPDPFLSEWRPINELERQDPNGRYFFLLADPVPELGLRTTLVCDKTYRLLVSMGYNDKRTHYLMLRRSSSVCKPSVSREIRTCTDPDMQKGVATIIGMCGKVNEHAQTWFSVYGCGDAERKYYESTYGFKDAGTCMYRSNSEHFARHLFHIHMQVILRANYEVIRKISEIKQLAGGLMPLRVKTDSLTYSRMNLRTPFHRRAEDRLAVVMEPAANCLTWHFEPTVLPTVRPKMMPLRYVQSLLVDDYSSSHNITYIGPPGTGKTTTAMASFKPDYIASFSNKNARRLGGITVHALFNMVPHLDYSQPNFERVRDALVFVDEAQCLSRDIWGVFMHAYDHYNTRFVFAMDPNQLGPVGEYRVPDSHPFYGNIRRMTVDHRNDVELQEMRDSVLDGTFVPLLDNNAPLTDVNIAYSNRGVDSVNALVAQAKGLSFGDDGPYISTLNVLHMGIAKSQIFERKNGVMKCIDSGSIVRLTVADLRRYKFKWAWCTTIHKRIGTEVPETQPITVWEVEPGNAIMRDKSVMYTAITRAFSYSQLIFRSNPPYIE